MVGKKLTWRPRITRKKNHKTTIEKKRVQFAVSKTSRCLQFFLLPINHLLNFMSAKTRFSISLWFVFLQFLIFIHCDDFMRCADNETRCLNFESNSITSKHAFKCRLWNLSRDLIRYCDLNDFVGVFEMKLFLSYVPRQRTETRLY